MQRERVADDIYIFTSELYVQVTAGAIISSEGAILIDTLAFPKETRAIKSFLEDRLGCPVLALGGERRFRAGVHTESWDGQQAAVRWVVVSTGCSGRPA